MKTQNNLSEIDYGAPGGIAPSVPGAPGVPGVSVEGSDGYSAPGDFGIPSVLGAPAAPEPTPESPSEPAPEPTPERRVGRHARRRKRRILREIVEILIFIALAVVLTTLIRTFVIDNYEIPTGSMEPTIEVDDRLFAEKVSYHFVAPKQGDIVTFQDPVQPGRILIKRCIATGGQTVDLIDGIVYIDGVPLYEPYTHGKLSLPLETVSGLRIEYPYTVPEGSVWMMGDNRTSSLDSRHFGPVPEDDLIGKALFRFLPLNRFGPIDD